MLDMLATDLNKDPHPPLKPLPEGRAPVKLRPLRRRSRGERAPVKLGALCPRSGRERAWCLQRSSTLSTDAPLRRLPGSESWVF